MPLYQIYYFYMAVVGIVSGLIMVRSPEVASYIIKPYFWVLIAVAVFDIACYFRGQRMLALNYKIIGFVIGLVWLFLLPYLFGVQAYLF